MRHHGVIAGNAGPPNRGYRGEDRALYLVRLRAGNSYSGVILLSVLLVAFIAANPAIGFAFPTLPKIRCKPCNRASFSSCCPLSLNGSGISQIGHDVWPLRAFLAVAVSMALIRYRDTLD